MTASGRKPFDRIVVRGANWVGDAVMTLPALRRLRAAFPESRISFITTTLTAGLFDSCSDLDEVIIYQRREKGWRAFLELTSLIRRQDFDLAILFQNAFEAALIARLGGIPQRVGYAGEGRDRLLTDVLVRPKAQDHRHQIHDYLDLIAKCEEIASGSSLAPDPPDEEEVWPQLKVSPKQRADATSLLVQTGFRPGYSPLIAINPGATNSRAKRWLPERFAALADRLIRDWEAQVIVIGAPSEREIGDHTIALMAETGAHNLAGQTTIGTLVGILSHCDLLVSNDTGPAHISAALRRPTLTIFGPTNEYQTAPLGEYSRIVRADGIECERCMFRDCPIDHRCMTRLAVELVAAEASRLLGPLFVEKSL